MSAKITPTASFPLTWPASRERTQRRGGSKFKPHTVAAARDHLVAELSRMGARQIVISCNLPPRGDGLPGGDYAREPEDPGVACYFSRTPRPGADPVEYVLACDTFDRAWKNLHALALTIESLRAIERFGAGQLLEQAMGGFLALPPARSADPPWHEVLQLPASASAVEKKAARDRLALQHHPDHGGDVETFGQVQRAYERSLEP